MANMDYPAPCTSCPKDEVCFLPEDSIRATDSERRERSRFWNALSDTDNRKMIEGDWSL